MQLRISRFLHRLPLGADRVLVVHAISQARLTVDREVDAVLDFFVAPRLWPDEASGLAALPYDRATLLGCVEQLRERGLLTEKSTDDELTDVQARLGATYGRDPLALLDSYRRAMKQGSDAYWSAGASVGLADLDGTRRRVDVVLLGDCDLQMESDFLRREASRRGIDLRVAATFPDDVRFAAEHPHDAVIIGALRSRHSLTAPPASPDASPHAGYIAEASHILEGLRAVTAAPILIDNLPEPTVQPLGMAERGLGGHRARFRVAN